MGAAQTGLLSFVGQGGQKIRWVRGGRGWGEELSFLNTDTETPNEQVAPAGLVSSSWVILEHENGSLEMAKSRRPDKL